jgi:hypothetical protein
VKAKKKEKMGRRGAFYGNNDEREAVSYFSFSLPIDVEI